MGMNHVSPLEMGTRGRGRVSDVPIREDAEFGGEREEGRRQLGQRQGANGKDQTLDEVER